MPKQPKSIIRRSSLEVLPVEILNRICNDVDVYSLLCSLRNTCRRLRTVIKQYEYINLDCRSFSKRHFQHICHVIDPKNVRSLSLSGDWENGRIVNLFVTSFKKKVFTRIRHVTLIEIHENNLRNILKLLNFLSLVSFSLKFSQSDRYSNNASATLLSSMLTRSHLRRLDLDLHPGRIEEIVWYVKSPIEYLSIGPLMNINVICDILQHFSRLRTLICNCGTSNDSKFSLDRMIPTSKFTQLTSLTLNRLESDSKDLELLLALVPSVTYLKLTGTGNYLNGNRWKNFLETNLPLLTQFEFFFNEILHPSQVIPDINLIISSFSTNFWLKTKEWFVTCEYNVENPKKIFLYSLPICVLDQTYDCESVNISLSTKIEIDANIIL
ncbi:unnamed protein product [Rotaria socialis]|uniref:F-box domain-containing protein n=1 Tax=Rotaria socialis TaxID=392032 RepID=A0A820XP12_9BILA|nr:unnamed protein product [Rotaria socialis]CAF4536234.1 unnamed protein product [Rotaria socialis]